MSSVLSSFSCSLLVVIQYFSQVRDNPVESNESMANNVRASELFLTKVSCDSLPCLPYHRDALVMCAVCSQ
ncbi:hypothetical protein ACOMHN_039164 [Nucella lapillus]